MQEVGVVVWGRNLRFWQTKLNLPGCTYFALAFLSLPILSRLHACFFHDIIEVTQFMKQHARYFQLPTMKLSIQYICISYTLKI